MPSKVESGAAIASPIGLNMREPIASKDETLESESLGTLRCKAVLQRVPQRSNVMPNKKAPTMITASDWGLARDAI